jgi:hypothetical protein
LPWSVRNELTLLQTYYSHLELGHLSDNVNYRAKSLNPTFTFRKQSNERLLLILAAGAAATALPFSVTPEVVY